MSQAHGSLHSEVIQALLEELGGRLALLGVEARVAAEYRLPPDWLNTSAAAFLPPTDTALDGDTTVTGALTVVVASPEVLLSMKMMADRERDVPDLIRLVQHMGLERPGEVVAIVRRTYPTGVGWREPTDEELRRSATEIIDAARD